MGGVLGKFLRMPFVHKSVFFVNLIVHKSVITVDLFVHKSVNYSCVHFLFVIIYAP